MYALYSIASMVAIAGIPTAIMATVAWLANRNV